MWRVKAVVLKHLLIGALKLVTPKPGKWLEQIPGNVELLKNPNSEHSIFYQVVIQNKLPW